eukprot:1142766-Pelagomonas_calceolata.AAC.10
MERMFDLMKERLEPLNLQVKAPIAYVRARLQDGCHNDLQHPSLIVLWHQHKDILKEVTGWQYFFRRFPHKLLVDEDIMYEASAPWQESISDMLENRKAIFSQRVNVLNNKPEDDELLKLPEVNKVFPKDSVLKVRQLPQQSLGVRKASTSLQAVVEDQLWAASPGSFGSETEGGLVGVKTPESRSQPPAPFNGTGYILGRGKEVETLCQYFSKDTKQRGLLLWGPAGMGKSTLAELVQKRMWEKGLLGDVEKCDMFGVTDYGNMISAICLGLGMSPPKVPAADDVVGRIVDHLNNKSQGKQKLTMLWLDGCEEVLARDGIATAFGDLLAQRIGIRNVVLKLAAIKVKEGKQLYQGTWYKPNKLFQVAMLKHPTQP